jgi:hypothetical protein
MHCEIMSSIPSDIVSSVAGAPLTSREVARDREAAGAAQAHAASRQTKAVTDAGDIVETTDADAQVFTDSEGTGSQGRHSESDTPQPEAEKTGSPRGIIRDQEGRVHLDLEA